MKTIELLTWEGCPSTQEALDLCARAASDLGLAIQIQQREVNSYEQAQSERFIGSPTFRIDGVDLFFDENRHFGLGCRVYTKLDGRVGPLPDFSDFKSKLKMAIK